MIPPHAGSFPAGVFPPDEWRLVESELRPDYQPRLESVFALSNGFLGVRGAAEDHAFASAPATLVSGLYDTWPIAYPEDFPGLARTGQALVPAPDATRFVLKVDGEVLDPETSSLLEYERTLDFRSGMLTREIVWCTSQGKRARVRSRRLVSLTHPSLVVMDYEVTLLDEPATIEISSMLTLPGVPGTSVHPVPMDRDPRRAQAFEPSPLTLQVQKGKGSQILRGCETTNSRMRILTGVDHKLEAASECALRRADGGEECTITGSTDAQAGQPVRMTKYATYHRGQEEDFNELAEHADEVLSQVTGQGMDRLREEQEGQLAEFWADADVRLELGDQDGGRTQQAIRANLFHVAQATWWRASEGVPAKGLTGQGYDGHVFWDGEMYLAPVLSYTRPETARALLDFRVQTMEKARERAEELGHAGVLLPWRTINGQCASPYFLAGTAQYHVNSPRPERRGFAKEGLLPWRNSGFMARLPARGLHRL